MEKKENKQQSSSKEDDLTPGKRLTGVKRKSDTMGKKISSDRQQKTDAGHNPDDTISKKITSDQIDDRSIEARESEPSKANNDDVIPAVPEITGRSRQERLRNATISGGLRVLPEIYNDPDGDWQTIKSENFFERLYLDQRSYEQITPKMVEHHFHLIDEFWNDKIIAAAGPTRSQILRKFADDGPEKVLHSYRRFLKQAYKQLSDAAGVHTYYTQLEAERIQQGKERLEPRILKAFEDGILEPAEEEMIIDLGLSDTKLERKEIIQLIDEYLEHHPSAKRGIDLNKEQEKPFLRQILRKLKDHLLSVEEETELLEDAPFSNISEARAKILILHALHEHGDAERESTIEQDKKAFKDFYYSLLQQHSLETNDTLPEEAAQKLQKRDDSNTEFFPLRDKNRAVLIAATIKQYKADLKSEKDRFYQEALVKLDIYDQRENASVILKTDPAYKLLLMEMRVQLLNDAEQEIIDKQSTLFLKGAKEFYQMKFWKPADEENDKFINDPNHALECDWIRCDWLADGARKRLFSDATDWAQREYQTEVSEFRKWVQKTLEKNIYGLPLSLQLEMESDTQFHLSKHERRELLMGLEEGHRKNAEKEFNNTVAHNLVFQTLIPNREEALLKEGKSKYLLDSEKIKNSIPVNSAQEIINNLRTTFGKVIEKQVAELFEKYKMDEEIVKKHKLSHSAYLSQKELDSLINEYHPNSAHERKTVLNAFLKVALKAGLYIISEDKKTEFSAQLHKAMETASFNYKRRLKKWFTDKFQSDMLKVGAAFGRDEKSIRVALNNLRNDYKEWTTPKWSRFSLVFILGATIFTSLRFFASLTGYKDWLPASGPVQMYSRGNFNELLNFYQAGGYGHGWPHITIYIAISLTIIGFSIFQAKKYDKDIGVTIFWMSLVALFLANFTSKFVTTLLIYVIFNAGLILGNLAIFIWYILQNAWAITLKLLAFIDLLLCGIPYAPEPSWAIYGALLFIIIGFFYSIKGLRKPFLKFNLYLVSLFLMVNMALFYFSRQAIQDFDNREKIVLNEDMTAIVKDQSIDLRKGKSYTTQIVKRLYKGKKIAILDELKYTYKIRTNIFHGLIDGYIPRHSVTRLAAANAPTVTIGTVLPKQGGILRRAPSISAERIGALPFGSEVIILDKKAKWYQVRYKLSTDSGTGYGYIYYTTIKVTAKKMLKSHQNEPLVKKIAEGKKSTKENDELPKGFKMEDAGAQVQTDIPDTNKIKKAYLSVKLFFSNLFSSSDKKIESITSPRVLPTGIVLPDQGGIVREAASKDANRVAALAAHAKVIVLGKKSKWFLIRYKSGSDSTDGYIYHSILQITGDDSIPNLQSNPVLANEYLAKKEISIIPDNLDNNEDEVISDTFNVVQNIKNKLKPDSIIHVKNAPVTNDISSKVSGNSDTLMIVESDKPKEHSPELGKGGVTWIFIKGGTFEMGDTSMDGNKDERPVHEVRINDFHLSKYEITVKQFRAFCQATGHAMPEQPPWNKENHPVVNVSWQDAVDFCRWIGGRLPTEAEWEFAVRERGKRINTTLDFSQANHADLNTDFLWASSWDDNYVYTAPVGSYSSNRLGLYDLTGNVWEWCQDWYGADYYSLKVRDNPQGPSVAEHRVFRGGAWNSHFKQLRYSNRGHSLPTVKLESYGFRPAR